MLCLLCLLFFVFCLVMMVVIVIVNTVHVDLSIGIGVERHHDVMLCDGDCVFVLLCFACVSRSQKSSLRGWNNEWYWNKKNTIAGHLLDLQIIQSYVIV